MFCAGLTGSLDMIFSLSLVMGCWDRVAVGRLRCWNALWELWRSLMVISQCWGNHQLSQDMKSQEGWWDTCHRWEMRRDWCVPAKPEWCEFSWVSYFSLSFFFSFFRTLLCTMSSLSATHYGFTVEFTAFHLKTQKPGLISSSTS